MNLFVLGGKHKRCCNKEICVRDEQFY